MPKRSVLDLKKIKNLRISCDHFLSQSHKIRSFFQMIKYGSSLFEAIYDIFLKYQIRNNCFGFL